MTKCLKVYWNKESFNRSFVKPEDYTYFKVFLYDSKDEEDILSHIPAHFFYKIDELPHYVLNSK